MLNYVKNPDSGAVGLTVQDRNFLFGRCHSGISPHVEHDLPATAGITPPYGIEVPPGFNFVPVFIRRSQAIRPAAERDRAVRRHFDDRRAPALRLPVVKRLPDLPVRG